MSKISICIPTYEMHGRGKEYLRHSFDIMCNQTFSDFEVVVSDHSEDDRIASLCEEYSKHLEISYLKNEEDRGNSSANLNNALDNANGEILKVLFQDDYLYDEKSMEILDETFYNCDWLVSRCQHSPDGYTNVRDFMPEYHDNIHLGNNTISSPSVLAISREAVIPFDENLIWLMDCDYYKNCYNHYGPPKILRAITVVNRTWANQVSAGVTQQVKESELEYVKAKYDNHGTI